MRKNRDLKHILLVTGIAMLLAVSGCSLFSAPYFYLNTLDIVWEDNDNIIVCNSLAHRPEQITEAYGLAVIRINVRTGKQKMLYLTLDYIDYEFRGFRKTNDNIYFILDDCAYSIQGDSLVKMYDYMGFEISYDEKIYTYMDFDNLYIVNTETDSTTVKPGLVTDGFCYAFDYNNLRVYLLSTNDLDVQVYYDIIQDTTYPFRFIDYPSSVTNVINYSELKKLIRINADTIEINSMKLEIDVAYCGIYYPFNPSDYYVRSSTKWCSNDLGDYIDVKNSQTFIIYNVNGIEEREINLSDL